MSNTPRPQLDSDDESDENMELDRTPSPPEPQSRSTSPEALPSGNNASESAVTAEDGVAIAKQPDLGTLPDADMDMLIERFPEALQHNGTCTLPSRRSSKGYSMRITKLARNHAKEAASFKQQQRMRRLMGLHSGICYPRRLSSAVLKPLLKNCHCFKFGFDPAQAIKRRAIIFPEAYPYHKSTLTSGVHAMFKEDNFHGCPSAVYAQLQPALRLATLLLASKATATFWHTLCFGTREPCEKTSAKMGTKCHRIRKSLTYNEDQATRFQKHLDRQVSAIHFFFNDDPIPDQPDAIHWASTGLVNDYKTGFAPRPDDRCRSSKIALHTDFYTIAKKLSVLKHPDHTMIMRFSFNLAICICHEIAHFFEVAGPHQSAHGTPAHEVFLGENMWAESGISFECTIFGGRVHPISNRVDGAHGITIFDWPRKEAFDREDTIYYTVPMDYIAWIQQQSTWDKDLSSSDNTTSNILRIPRTGCRAAGWPALSTLVWEDEEEAGISDDLDEDDTPFKRTSDGKIIKRRQPPSALLGAKGRRQSGSGVKLDVKTRVKVNGIKKKSKRGPRRIWAGKALSNVLLGSDGYVIA